MEQKEYHDEQELQQMLYDGDITMLEYVTHQSPQMTEQFKDFCRKNGLEENSASAVQFDEWLLEQEEKTHTDGLD